MNGSEKQIKWAEKIIIDFVTGCENAKTSLTERIENYHRRATKTGKDFSENIADVNNEIAIINQSIAIANSADDASQVINCQSILEKITKSISTEWDNQTLANVKFAICGRK